MQSGGPRPVPDGLSFHVGSSTVPAMPAAVASLDVPRHDTPVIAAYPLSRGTLSATLTLLTGVNAGHLIAVDAAGVIIGRGAGADLVVDDEDVSRRHARVGRTADGGFYVEDLGSTNGTFVGASRVGVLALEGGEVLQLGRHILLRFACLDASEESLFRQLYDSSVRDPLTQLFNRRYLADRLVSEVSRAGRAGGDLSLIMADVDSLKYVNDTFGHIAGDRALCVVAIELKRVIRVEDVLARYGGDEFVIVAPGSPRLDAMHLGERARRAVEELRLGARGQSVHLTMSMGLASLAEVRTEDEPIVALLALADARLYAAKSAGRNRVCSDSPPENAHAP